MVIDFVSHSQPLLLKDLPAFLIDVQAGMDADSGRLLPEDPTQCDEASEARKLPLHHAGIHSDDSGGLEHNWEAGTSGLGSECDFGTA